MPTPALAVFNKASEFLAPLFRFGRFGPIVWRKRLRITLALSIYFPCEQ